VVSFKPPVLYTLKRSPVTSEKEAGRDSKPVWEVYKRQETLALTKIQIA